MINPPSGGQVVSVRTNKCDNSNSRFWKFCEQA